MTTRIYTFSLVVWPPGRVEPRRRAADLPRPQGNLDRAGAVRHPRQDGPLARHGRDRTGLPRGLLDPRRQPAGGQPVHGLAWADGGHAARSGPRRDPGRSEDHPHGRRRRHLPHDPDRAEHDGDVPHRGHRRLAYSWAAGNSLARGEPGGLDQAAAAGLKTGLGPSGRRDGAREQYAKSRSIWDVMRNGARLKRDNIEKVVMEFHIMSQPT